MQSILHVSVLTKYSKCDREIAFSHNSVQPFSNNAATSTKTRTTHSDMVRSDKALSAAWVNLKRPSCNQGEQQPLLCYLAIWKTNSDFHTSQAEITVSDGVVD